MDYKMKDKTALVFGASSGIGFGIAGALYGEEVKLSVASREGPKLQALESKFPKAHRFAGDLSQGGEAKRVVEQVIHKSGALDILVLNTGGPHAGTFETTNRDDWAQGFQSLWLSTVEAIQTVLPTMKKNGYGRIVLVASTSAREPIPNLTVSNGIRAGLIGLMKSLSTEVAAHSITVNSILPGYIDTEHLRELGRKEEEMIQQVPAGRLGKIEEIGALAAFLASPQAAYITGQAIACDGGRLKSF